MRGGRRGIRAALMAMAIAVCLSALAACADDTDDTLDVFAASSLRNAFAEIAEAWQREPDAIEVRLNVAGSSALREQLLDGAAGDVFVSANQDVFDSLSERGVFDDSTARTLTTNELMLAVPLDQRADFPGIEALGDDNFFVGACASGVPCGDLADEAVERLALLGIEVTFDTREPDVGSLTRRLVDGELDAAFVYVTELVAFEGELAEIALPERFITTYPIAAIADSPNAEAARSFIEFATGLEGREILARWGFGGPREP